MPQFEAPPYWHVLNSNDQSEYMKLKEKISPLTLRASKSKIAENYLMILELLKNYIVRGDEDDWKRSLVCGIFWTGSKKIVINTKHLAALFGKCKSSVNNGFQEIKYYTAPFTPEIASTIMKLFPFMKDNCNETRQWTPRMAASEVNCTDIFEPMIQMSSYMSPIQENYSDKVGPKKDIKELELDLDAIFFSSEFECEGCIFDFDFNATLYL